MTAKGRQAERTKQVIRQSFVALVAEKGWEKTTVQDIVDRANIGRSTFYSHYETKETLLAVGMFEEIKKSIPATINDSRSSMLDTLPTLEILEHVSQQKNVAQALTRGNGLTVITKAITTLLVEQILTYCQANETTRVDDRPPASTSIDQLIEAHYVARAFVGLLEWWIEYDFPISADQLHQQYRLLSSRGAS